VNFVVRVSVAADGRLHGVVTHPQSGRKEPFDSVAKLGELIAAMAVARKPAKGGLSGLDEKQP
jgi:hypothetical protein